ncbi:MAG: sensor domain-containing diguanylate cyclase [Anaerolineales bacterium]
MKAKPSLPRSIVRRVLGGDLLEAEKEYVLELLIILGKTLEEQGVLPSGQVYNRLLTRLTDDSRLLNLLGQPVAELEALKRISFNLTSSLDLSTVLRGVVDEALRLVKNASDANIFLYSEGQLTFGAALDVEGKRDTQFAEPRPNGLTYTVARQKRMIVVENMRAHPLFRDAPPDWKGSIVGLPLMMGSRVVGVMNLSRTVTGPFSPAEIRLLTLLADQAAIAIVNARLHQAVSRQARIDVLTGLPNRRGLDERLEQEIAQAERLGGVFSVMMLDIDGFKQVNDAYGHEAGDDILRQVATALLRTVRASDFLARYGGDEMTLVLPGTDLPQAQVVAQKIHEHMQNLVLILPAGKTIKLEISGGIAMYPLHGRTAAGLLRAADEALYHAKRVGRGRFLLAETDED